LSPPFTEALREISPGIRFMAGAALSFSVMAALVKLAGRSVPTMEVVLVRSLVVALLAWVSLSRRGVSPLGHDRGLLLLRGLLGFLSLSCFYYALIHLPLADATVIQYTNPVFTALIAAVVLGEVMGRREVTLTLASLAGVVLVARPSFLLGGGEGLPSGPVLVALAGAVLSAAAYVTVRRLRREDVMVVILYFSVMSVLLSLPFVGGFRLPTGPESLLLLGVGVFTFLGQVSLTWGLRLETAGRATSVGYLQLLFAALWGVLLFQEVPDGFTVLGGGVIVGCTYLLARSRALPTVAPGGGSSVRSER